MAYNVLKGSVQFINSNSGSIESMVDDYSNQTIAGVKTFSGILTASSGLSASVLYAPNITSTSASFAELTISSSVTHTPLLILDKAEASSSFIEFRKEGVKHAEIRANNVETFIIKTEATSYPIWFQQAGNYPLKFQDSLATFQSYPVHVSQSLHVTGSSFINNLSASNEISASAFFGSGQGLANIPATALNLGNGLEPVGGNLVAKLSGSSGMVLGTEGLGVDPNNAISISGGSLASADQFLVADSDQSNGLRKATMTNLQTYMQDSLSFRSPAGSQNEIQFKDGAGNFAASSNLTFNSSTNILTVAGQLTASGLVSSSFYGDGGNLTNLAAAELVGNVNAGNINIGNGLFDDAGKLAVSASYGLTASANGLEITASNTSGLDVIPAIGGIVVSPSRTAAKASPVAGDIIIIGDSADSNKAKNASLTSVVTLVQNNGAAGSNTQVQFNNSNAFAGSSNFTFNSATNTLAIQEVSSSGNISASFFYGDGSNLQNVGGQEGFNSYTADFTVPQESDIIGIVTTGSAITASLSAANTYGQGQRFVFKDVSGSCSGSNHIVISASAYGSGDRIDGQGVVKIQTGYGAITIASDGVNSFYIMGTI